jgi:glycine cleavage system H protein
MNVREDFFYLPTHEWVQFVDETTALIGISDYAQHALGDIVYISLPDVDDTIEQGKSFCDIESVKAVSDVYAPVTGLVIAINEELEDTPEKLNESPFDTWIVKVEGTFNREQLLDSTAYKKLLEQEG